MLPKSTRRNNSLIAGKNILRKGNTELLSVFALQRAGGEETNTRVLMWRNRADKTPWLMVGDEKMQAGSQLSGSG